MAESGSVKKFARLVLKTACGPFAAWCCTSLLLFAAIAASPALGGFGTVLVAAMLVVQAVLAAVCALAFFISLGEREWSRAVGQFFFGCAGIFLFVLGLGAATMANWSVASATAKGGAEARSASVTNATGALEFAVEYRPAHPFLAEYGKCIVFPSGGRTGVWPDTGGAGAFAVYRLPSGEYYLIDGLEHDFIRNDYRVNTANETVEIMCGETWVKIPGGTIEISGRSGDSIFAKTKDGETRVEGGTPVGNSLEARAYVGLLHPDGRFEPCDGDPFADVVEPEWKPAGFDGGKAPFSLEYRSWKGSRHYRMAFASGMRIALDSGDCTRDREEGYSLYALEDGRWHLAEARRENVKWRKEWRIDSAGKSIEVMFKDHWNRHGDLWVKIPDGATAATGDVVVRSGNDGRLLGVSIEVATENGKATGHDFVPVGDSLSGARFIGTFRATAGDRRPESEKRAARTSNAMPARL